MASSVSRGYDTLEGDPATLAVGVRAAPAKEKQIRLWAHPPARRNRRRVTLTGPRAPTKPSHTPPPFSGRKLAKPADLRVNPADLRAKPADPRVKPADIRLQHATRPVGGGHTLSGTPAPKDQKMSSTVAENPLLLEWGGPLGLPPFASIRAEHFEPALSHGMARHLAEVDAIAENPAEATFENTCLAFDRAGAILSAVSRVFGNLCSAETNPDLQAVERTMAPRLAAHSAAISLHAGVFARIDSLHRRIDSLGLTPVEERLLRRQHLDFVRGGAMLSGEPRARVGALAEELATLQTQFAQNVLADETGWHLVLPSEADRAGLPDGDRQLVVIELPSARPFADHPRRAERDLHRAGPARRG